MKQPAFRLVLAAWGGLLIWLTSAAIGQTCRYPSFTGPIDLTGVNSPFLAGDFDEDGLNDLLDFSGSANGYQLLLNRGNGQFTPKPIALTDLGVWGVARDFNGDRHLDLVETGIGTVRLLLGDGHGGFTEMPATSTTGIAGSGFVADFDGDGLLDLLIGGTDAGNPDRMRFALLKGDGRGGLAAPVFSTLEAPYQTVLVAAADFNGDGQADIVLIPGAPRCGSMTVYAGDGRGGFVAPLGSVIGGHPVIADLNEDGIPDIVGGCGDYSAGLLQVAFGHRGGDLTNGPILKVGLYGLFDGHVGGDFDGDGHVDIVAASTTGMYFFRGDGKGSLGPPLRIANDEILLSVADLNGDRLPDLITRDSSRLTTTVRMDDCAQPRPQRKLLIPIVLDLTGANGTRFSSALSLVNSGASTAAIESTYTPAIGGGASVRGLAFVGPGEQVDDPGPFLGLLAALGAPTFPQSTTFAGTLQLRVSGVSPDDLAAVGVVRSTPDGKAFGGVGLPAVPLSDTLTGDSVIGWLRETENDRTNLALVNAGDDDEGDVTLRVTVVSGDPEHPDAAVLPDISLPPGGFRQINRVLTEGGLGGAGFARVERIAGSAPYWAWATVNDNANGDGSVVPPIDAHARAGETTLVLPVLVEVGGLTSELVVTNAAPVAKTVRFEWLADAVATTDHTVRFTLRLGAGGQVTIPSFVRWLREQGVPGTAEPGAGPPGHPYAGALFATVEEGDVQGLFVGARTSSPGVVGRYGVFYAASGLSELAGTTAWLYGLEQNDARRTNLALVNAAAPGEEPGAFRIELFDGYTGRLYATLEDVALAPRAWTQLPLVLAPYAPRLRSAYARITRVAGTGPFLAYAVVNDGPGPGLGTGDGSFLPMRAVRDPAPSSLAPQSRRSTIR